MKRRGQSVLEYVVMLSAIVAAIVAGAVTIGGSRSGDKGLGKLLNKSIGSISNKSSELTTLTK